MKKVLFVLVLISVIFGFVFLQKGANTQYLRIHIRANSNSQSDQEVKYKVKDAVTEYLIPFLAEITDKRTAEKIINAKLCEVEEVANEVLTSCGFDYGARAKICTEEFPTRYYGEFCLESGLYDALILELGSGEGDNWWCVIYPPLCFIPTQNGSGDIYYKSKILEIIEDFCSND